MSNLTDTTDKSILNTAKAFLRSIEIQEHKTVVAEKDATSWREMAVLKNEQLVEAKNQNQELLEQVTHLSEAVQTANDDAVKREQVIERLQRKVERLSPKKPRTAKKKVASKRRTPRKAAK
jgi:hypothetical protein